MYANYECPDKPIVNLWLVWAFLFAHHLFSFFLFLAGDETHIDKCYMY